jgi:hypothetical protein
MADRSGVDPQVSTRAEAAGGRAQLPFNEPGLLL